MNILKIIALALAICVLCLAGWICSAAGKAPADAYDPTAAKARAGGEAEMFPD